MVEDVFAVDADELSALVDDLARGHAALTDLAADLERRLADLDHTWAGASADAHATAQAAWDDGFAGMREALLRMRQAADVAHRNYSSAAATNLQMWEQAR